MVPGCNQTDLIPVGVQPKVFQCENRSHPNRPTDTLDAEYLAAQIFGSFDATPRHDIISNPVGKRRQDFQIRSARSRAQNRSSAGIADLNVARGQCRDQGRRLSDEDHFGGDAVLREKALLFGRPEWKNSCVDRSVGNDGPSGRGRCVESFF